MDRIYHEYKLWEDYNNGMYSMNDVLDKDKIAFNCVSLLSDVKLFNEVCLLVLDNWKYSSDVNLSNAGKNRRAWLGAAACSYKYKAPEYVTRIAWGLLNKDIQDRANNVAESIIKIYEEKNRGIYKNLGNTVLF